MMSAYIDAGARYVLGDGSWLDQALLGRMSE